MGVLCQMVWHSFLSEEKHKERCKDFASMQIFRGESIQTVVKYLLSGTWSHLSQENIYTCSLTKVFGKLSGADVLHVVNQNGHDLGRTGEKLVPSGVNGQAWFGLPGFERKQWEVNQLLCYRLWSDRMYERQGKKSWDNMIQHTIPILADI